jgi:hypothetical protein
MSCEIVLPSDLAIRLGFWTLRCVNEVIINGRIPIVQTVLGKNKIVPDDHSGIDDGDDSDVDDETRQAISLYRHAESDAVEDIVSEASYFYEQELGRVINSIDPLTASDIAMIMDSPVSDLYPGAVLNIPSGWHVLKEATLSACAKRASTRWGGLFRRKTYKPKEVSFPHVSIDENDKNVITICPKINGGRDADWLVIASLPHAIWYKDEIRVGIGASAIRSDIATRTYLGIVYDCTIAFFDEISIDDDDSTTLKIRSVATGLGMPFTIFNVDEGIDALKNYDPYKKPDEVMEPAGIAEDNSPDPVIRQLADRVRSAARTVTSRIGDDDQLPSDVKPDLVSRIDVITRLADAASGLSEDKTLLGMKSASNLVSRLSDAMVRLDEISGFIDRWHVVMEYDPRDVRSSMNDLNDLVEDILTSSKAGASKI